MGKSLLCFPRRSSRDSLRTQLVKKAVRPRHFLPVDGDFWTARMCPKRTESRTHDKKGALHKGEVSPKIRTGVIATPERREVTHVQTKKTLTRLQSQGGAGRPFR